MEAEASSRHWESKAKEAIERAVRPEVERDAAPYEASMARLDVEAVGSAQAHVEYELGRGPTHLSRFRGCLE